MEGEIRKDSDWDTVVGTRGLTPDLQDGDEVGYGGEAVRGTC